MRTTESLEASEVMRQAVERMETEIKYLKEELSIQKLLTKSWFMECEKLKRPNS